VFMCPADPARSGVAGLSSSPEVCLLRLLLEVEAHQRAADEHRQARAANGVDGQGGKERRVDRIQDACAAGESEVLRDSS
jgi:hypothetical protein